MNENLSWQPQRQPRRQAAYPSHFGAGFKATQVRQQSSDHVDMSTSMQHIDEDFDMRFEIDSDSSPSHESQSAEVGLPYVKAGARATDEDAIVDKRKRGWRRIVRNFNPSWFSVNMGTGIVSILLHNLPYNGSWLYWISVVIFCLNVVLFVVAFVISVLRYTLYPAIWRAMIRHPSQSFFIGTFPMGLSTIVNMVVFVCVPAWGHRAVQLAWALWWIDATISIMICLYLPFVIIYYHKARLSTMTAVWLLPIVCTIVAASSGAIVANVLPNPQHALWTIIVSYVLWGAGVPLAMMVLVVYFHRLVLYHLPPLELIVSVFLPLGPLGQGGFAIMQLGADAMAVFPKTGTLSATTIRVGDILYTVGWLIAIIMWGFALVWLFMATASISRSKFPFNMGWWGFTFPLGVFTVSTTTIAKELPSEFFKILGTILSVAVTLLWLVVAAGTIRGAFTGELIFAPCLHEAEKAEAAKAAQKASAREESPV